MNMHNAGSELIQLRRMESSAFEGKNGFTNDEAVAYAQIAVLSGVAMAMSQLPESYSPVNILEITERAYTLAVDDMSLSDTPVALGACCRIREYVADMLEELKENDVAVEELLDEGLTEYEKEVKEDDEAREAELVEFVEEDDK